VAGLAARRRSARRAIKRAAVPTSARAFPDFERSALQGEARPFNTEAAAQHAGIVIRAISRFCRVARPRPGLMLGFSGFPRQLIVPAAARLATLVANRGRS
jgi:GntR family transcriptional regulator/MocR family aminotransferase